MEIAVFWFLTVFALGSEIEQAQEETAILAEEVEVLKQGFINLAGKHSTLYALHKLDHDTHHAKIDNIIDTLETLTENE